MRIIHVEDYFHPDAGYQVNILSKYMAKEGHEVFIVTSEMNKIPGALIDFFGIDNLGEKDLSFEQQTCVKIIRLPLRSFFSGRSIFTRSIFKIVDSLQPDILYLHGNDTYAAIRFILRTSKLKYPYIMDSHMVDMASVNRFKRLFHLTYRLLCTPIVKRRNIPVIRTVDVDYVYRRLGIPLKQAPLVGFGSDTEFFNKDDVAKDAIRKELGIKKNSFVILYAGKLDQTKGGMMLAQVSEKTFKAERDIVFLIIGNSKKDDYGEKIEEIFSQSKNHIIRIPTQPYIKLAKYYQSADIAVFPRQCSLSFFDVQVTGLPVIFEENEINISRSKHGGAFTFKEGDLKDFRQKIQMLIDMRPDKYQIVSQNAINYVLESYDYSKQYKKYMAIIEQRIRDFRATE